MKKDYLTNKSILISTVGVITIVIILAAYLQLPSYPTFAEFLEDYNEETRQFENYDGNDTVILRDTVLEISNYGNLTTLYVESVGINENWPIYIHGNFTNEYKQGDSILFEIGITDYYSGSDQFESIGTAIILK